MNPYSPATGTPQICHGCDGKRWVEVGDNPSRSLGYQLINKCPGCGGDRNNPALTGCPKGSHYGFYCEVGGSNAQG